MANRQSNDGYPTSRQRGNQNQNKRIQFQAPHTNNHNHNRNQNQIGLPRHSSSSPFTESFDQFENHRRLRNRNQNERFYIDHKGDDYSVSSTDTSKSGSGLFNPFAICRPKADVDTCWQGWGDEVKKGSKLNNKGVLNMLLHRVDNDLMFRKKNWRFLDAIVEVIKRCQVLQDYTEAMKGYIAVEKKEFMRLKKEGAPLGGLPISSLEKMGYIAVEKKEFMRLKKEGAPLGGLPISSLEKISPIVVRPREFHEGISLPYLPEDYQFTFYDCLKLLGGGSSESDKISSSMFFCSITPKKADKEAMLPESLQEKLNQSHEDWEAIVNTRDELEFTITDLRRREEAFLRSQMGGEKSQMKANAMAKANESKRKQAEARAAEAEARVAEARVAEARVVEARGRGRGWEWEEREEEPLRRREGGGGRSQNYQEEQWRGGDRNGGDRRSRSRSRGGGGRR